MALAVRRWLRAVFAAVLLAALACCVLPATEVRVRLDTNAPRTRALLFAATVYRGSSPPDASGAAPASSHHEWVRPAGGDAGGLDDGGALDAGRAMLASLPGSFAVIPGDGQPRDAPVTVVLEARLLAQDAQPEVAFRRVARFRFTPRRTTVVPIFLAIECGALARGCTSVAADRCTLSVLCEERHLTCGDQGACVPADVTPREEMDAEVAGPDARPDAPAPVDTAPLDAPAPVDVAQDVGAMCSCPSRPGATATCRGDAGCVYTCDPGRGDCDGVDTNGCEADLSTPEHCGTCTTTCSGATPLCSAPAGVCTSGCVAPQMRCGASCVDTTSSDANCGGCGRACAGGQRCVAGACACPAGQTLCAGACVDTATDRTNCGACGRACSVSEMCTRGACACSAGLTRCGASCVDTLTDPANCGACGVACTAGRACASGACACGAGLTYCSMAGACLDTTSDPLHCGPGCTFCLSSRCAASNCTLINDQCLNPVALAQDTSFPGDTCMALADVTACGRSSPDLEFVLVASVSGVVTIHATAGFEVVGIGGTACATSGGPCGNPLSVSVTAGVQYYWQVRSTGACGSFMTFWH